MQQSGQKSSDWQYAERINVTVQLVRIPTSESAMSAVGRENNGITELTNITNV